MIRIVLATLAWLLFLLPPALAWAGIAPPTPALGLFALGALLGVIAALAGCIAWARGKRDGASKFALTGVVPLVIMLGLAGPGMSNPRINDISTDLEDPPTFEHAKTLDALQGEDLAYPEEFKSIVREGYPDLGPLELDDDPASVYERALNVAQEQPAWTITRSDEENGIIEGYAQTAVFKWVDDFVIRIEEANGGTRVDMRSRSREGQGDLGANAKRIKRFFAQLSQAS